MKSSSINIKFTKLLRKHVAPLSVVAGKNSKFALERWLRGREEFLALQDAYAVIVSYGKSGRTWLRAMMTNYFKIRYELQTDELLEFDNLHALNRDIPKIFFTHDNYIKNYCHCEDSKQYFYNSKVVLLARNPIDVSVSQYFHWKHRMSPGKKELNRYPPHDAGTSLDEFIFMDSCGLPEIVRFMNLWASEFPKIKYALLVRYEDMKADAARVLADTLRFCDVVVDEQAVNAAVEQASFERMKSMESGDSSASGRLKTSSKDNPDSFKVRKGKVGGYRDYFDADTTARLENYCAGTLSPFYGYDFGIKNYL
jgi:alcohol sulfotransferase